MKTAYIYKKAGTDNGHWYDKATVYDVKSIWKLQNNAKLIIYGGGKEFFVPPGYMIKVTK